MIIIGSTAIKHWFPDFNREPKDLDIAYDLMLPTIKKEGAEYLENPILFKYSKAKAGEFLEPHLLLTLKMSHIFWNIKFDQHMFDIQFLLQKGVKYDIVILKELYEYWQTVHGKNTRSDLKMTKDDFFDNALKEFDHDHLHTLLNPTPTYLSMLKDGCEVEIDEEKFAKASFQDKENLVREEVENMAFERFRHLGYKHAYSKMLRKYLISHAPLWNIALFTIENWILLHKPNRNFVQLIEEQL